MDIPKAHRWSKDRKPGKGHMNGAKLREYFKAEGSVGLPEEYGARVLSQEEIHQQYTPEYVADLWRRVAINENPLGGPEDE